MIVMHSVGSLQSKATDIIIRRSATLEDTELKFTRLEITLANRRSYSVREARPYDHTLLILTLYRVSNRGYSSEFSIGHN